ncbi:MAG: FHIPEP family type III secretion protein [Planctomycetaceae bacterium]
MPAAGFQCVSALLLGTTLARLAHVASTRLILTEGATAGTDAAGGAIALLGEFVAAGLPIIGGIMFAILLARIQFLESPWATRISKVAA